MPINLKAVENSNMISDSHKARIEKLNAWREKGIDPYQVTHFDVDAWAADLQEQYKDLADGEVTDRQVRLAGRIMSNRNSGMFMDLQDHTGKIQIFSHKEHLNAETLDVLSLFDLGDWIGVEGIVRRTPRGELTVNAKTIHILSKSLQPLPEKHHGLTDVEIRYRKRYVDLTVSEKSRATFKKRSRIISAVRHLMEDQGFMEFETPVLQSVAGGANAKPFDTHHNALDMPLHLRIATELPLKKLIIGGVSDKVYELGRIFRNEGISTKHNPEFTTIETYEAFANVEDAMQLAEDIVIAACKAANNGETKVTYGEHEIDFAGPWPRKTMFELVQEKTGIDFLTIDNDEDARKACKEAGIHVDKDLTWGKCLEVAFEEKVEDTLIQPTHVMGHPKEISPLAKANPDNPRITDRFESFANGWEIANGFSELNDPFDQYERFKAQASDRASGDEEAQMMDEDFVEALEFGLPPTAGLGVGIDRVVMLMTDSPSIRDVIVFPTLRPAEAESIVAALDKE